MKLFQLLTLDSLGKVAVLSVKAKEYLPAKAAAVAFLPNQPAVVLTCISETPCEHP